ncbi:hypothetical protein LLEC1_06786, partial [Akanthomyces lecanii]
MRFTNLVPLLAAAALLVRAAQDDSQPMAPAEPMSLEHSLHQRGLVDDIWNKIKGAAACGGCESIMVLLKGIAFFGDAAFVGAVKSLCKLGKIQDPDVCDGVLDREGPTVARVIRELSMDGRSQKLFCGAILGVCDIPAVQPLVLKFPSKNPNRGRPTPSGNQPLKVVHFSDIHVDHHYTVGSNTACNKPICCRAYTRDDAPGTTKNPAGPFGDHKCDTPVSLEQSMYKAIKEAVPDVAFALFTGDIVDHTIWNTTKESNIHDSKSRITDWPALNDAMTIMDSHLKTVYGTVGNHEMSPASHIPSNNYAEQSNSAQWVYDLLAGYWTKWTGKETKSDIATIGAYSAKYLHGRLRVISLNTNLYYRHNYEVYHDDMEKDPNGQFAWLVEQLDAAETAGDRAYIMGHMPMGDLDALHDGSHSFDQIVNRYSDTIAAMFFGHTHVDHFELHYADYDDRSHQNARAVSYIAPSLTPTSGMPSFRVYDVAPETFAVLDVV